MGILDSRAFPPMAVTPCIQAMTSSELAFLRSKLRIRNPGRGPDQWPDSFSRSNRSLPYFVVVLSPIDGYWFAVSVTICTPKARGVELPFPR